MAHIPVARLRREATVPRGLAGADVFVRAARLRRISPLVTAAHALGKVAAIVAGVGVMIRGIRFLDEPPPLRRRRKRPSLREVVRLAYVRVDDRVRYSAEYLRTASGSGLELRRGRVVAERRIPNYPGDPSPRQVVMVRWDDDPEPRRILHTAVEPIGRSAAPQPS